MQLGAPTVECRSSFGSHWLGACRYYLQGAEKRVAFPLIFLGAALVLVQPCAGGSGVFDSTGSLGVARYLHTATLLLNGKLLVAAGDDEFNHPLASAELYDPSSETWTATGSLANARYKHTATLLPNGQVLVAGGFAGAGLLVHPLASSELYDPASGNWTATHVLATARYSHTATLLPNGHVLIVGGDHSLGGDYQASAELYDPASGNWTGTGSLTTARVNHTATLLSNGKVLVAGGRDLTFNPSTSAELYDPASGTWAATGSLTTARVYHTATLLSNGKVLVAEGGVASAALYDPASGTWAAAGNLADLRYGHTATLLPNGNVLVAGGNGGNPAGSLVSAELYDSANGTWTVTGSLGAARDSHTATLLPNGKVLIGAGGSDTSGVLTSAELYVQPPVPTMLGNISTRVRVGSGDNAMIGGFIITGTELKAVIVRGIGPSLALPGVLADPVIEIHGSAGQLLATNDNWRDGVYQEQVASTLPPASDLEPALWAILDPGTYTAVVRGKNDAAGLALFEVYDLDQTVDSKLANISTRGFVETGDDVMIGGTIITGNASMRVLLRAIGPSLTSLGVPSALPDPTLELYDGNGVLIAANDNWRSDQEAEIIATTIPPANDLESAIVQTLAPGNYTAIVRGVNGTTGVALVEVYALN